MKRILNPAKIELRSFEIIEGLLKGSKLAGPKRDIIKRVIHSTTDLDYARELLFHPKAIEAGLAAIRQGADIICDVSMVKAGIKAKTRCLINDKYVVKEAARLNIARAIVAMRKAARFMDGAIIAIGNAPTALFEVCDLVEAKKVMPALIIGVPVGFVGALETKKRLASIGVPYITNTSTKGGSAVAAAITNALLKLAREKR